MISRNPVSALFAGIALAALLAGCGDVVENTYPTKSAARADELFGKGWLPEFIPDGAVEIKTVNNPDLNTSSGGFRFPSGEWPRFSGHLSPHTNASAPFENWQRTVDGYRERGYQVLYHEEGDSVWAFFCRAARGECEYASWMRRPK
jgi:hypothetical protein